MKIGEWQVDALLAGAFKLDGGAMFGVVPKAIWSRVAPADEGNRIEMVMRCLLIRGHGKTIIVDTGSGEGYPDKLTRIYAFEDYAPMADYLGKFGLTAEEITDVIVTHLHFDHGGGVASPDGAGWRLTFPNATHHIQRSQWDHALNPNPRDRASYFRERIEIMDREGALVLHDGEWSMAPGLDLLVFHGHTPGQQLPKITAGGETLFFCGDLIPMAAHFPTPYIMAYDLQPVLAMEEKSVILKRVADEDWILFFEHDPRIAACRLEVTDGRFSPGAQIDL